MNKYSKQELKEFEGIIHKRLAETNESLSEIKHALDKSESNGTDATFGKVKGYEGGADALEKESLGQQAARLQKFRTNLENALVRIKNSTYGICTTSGKLISKERLRVVPHTTQSVDAKKNQI